MNSASAEWVARVAARNEIEEAKALRRLWDKPPYRVALNAGAPGCAGRGGRDGTESEVAR